MEFFARFISYDFTFSIARDLNEGPSNAFLRLSSSIMLAVVMILVPTGLLSMDWLQVLEHKNRAEFLIEHFTKRTQCDDVLGQQQTAFIKYYQVFFLGGNYRGKEPDIIINYHCSHSRKNIDLKQKNKSTEYKMKYVIRNLYAIMRGLGGG